MPLFSRMKLSNHEEDNMKQKIDLKSCSDYREENIKTAVYTLLDRYFSSSVLDIAGKNILLKPNLLSPNSPEKAVTTHPEILRQSALYFIEKNCSVIVADSPAGPFTAQSLDKVYRICRLSDLEKRIPLRLNRNLKGRKVSYPEGKNLKSFHLLEVLQEADFILNLPKLKTHSLAYYTGAVKNLYGLIPGLEKAYYHSKYPDKREFSRMLVDLCQYLKPNLSLMDAVIGMEGPGPSGGTAKKVGLLGLSENPYALDFLFSDLVSLPYKQIPVLLEAMDRNLIPKNISELEISGENIEDFKTVFQPAIEGSFSGNPISFLLHRFSLTKNLAKKLEDKWSPWPIMNDRCIGCERCKDLCPRQIIDMVEGKALPDYEKCIRCYCCHEICPVEAVDLKRR